MWPARGVQVRTRVARRAASGRSPTAAAAVVPPRRAENCARACPSRARSRLQPSLTKPSTDQVLTNSFGCLRRVRDLRVALGDVDDLDAERLRERAQSSGGARRFSPRRRCRARCSAAPASRSARRGRGSRHASAPPWALAVAACAASASRAARSWCAAAGRPGRCSRRPGLDAGVEVHRAAFPANLTSAIEDTSTDTFSTKSPRPTQRLQHAAEVLARQRFLDETDAVVIRPPRLPRSSAVTIVMRLGRMPMWRRISGSTPWPMLPKPTMTMRPGKVDVDLVLAHVNFPPLVNSAAQE
jgi:hypothetical protein